MKCEQTQPITESKPVHQILTASKGITTLNIDSNTENISANTTVFQNCKSIILATVSVESINGDKISVRAVLDPGAEENFISTQLVK